MALDPSVFAPQTDNSVPFSDFVSAYDEGITAADRQLEDAKKRATTALTAAQAIDPTDLTAAPARRSAEAELQHASAVVEQASKEAVDARTRKGQAIERYSQRGNIPQELKDRYASMAAVEKAQAQRILAENFEFLNAIPEKRDQLHATTVKAQADADLAKAQADLASATSPIQKQQAQAALDLAQQNVKNATANEASVRAGTGETIARTAQTGAQTDLVRQQVRTATAQANVAPQAAQAAVDQATANVNKTNQELADLQRQARQAPTDAQAQQAIQTQISQKQTELQAAQLQLQQAQKLMPLAVAGAEQTLQKNTLGTLYGLQDKAKAIADALRSGQITDPAVAQQQLQDYITTTIQGTTPFERDKFATEQQTTRRGQDLSLAGTQSGVLGSAFSSGLSTFGKLNDTVPVGSDAAGLGFIGSQRMMMANLQAMRPPAMDTPLLSSLRPTTAMPALPAVTPSITQPGGAIPAGASLPSDAGSPGHTININIGGTGGAAGVTPTSNPPAAGDPYANAASANTPAFLSNQRPATPDDVAALWAGDQHYDPTQQPNSGRAGVM